MTPIGLPVAMPVPDPRWIDSLKRRKEVTERMCTALRDYLCLDVEESLQRAESAPASWKPSLADLESAQQARETIQKQIHALEALCDSLPKENADLLEAVQMPMFESQLKQAEQWVSQIQSAIERDGPEEMLPAHRVSVVCGECSMATKDFWSSPAEASAGVSAQGWGRNAAGDHICPACVAKDAK